MIGLASEGTVRLASQAGENAILGSRPVDGRFAEAIRLGRGMQHAHALIAAEDNDLIAAALRAGAALGLTLANIVTLFAPPRVIITGSSLEPRRALHYQHPRQLQRRRAAIAGRRRRAGFRRCERRTVGTGGGSRRTLRALRIAMEHDRAGALAGKVESGLSISDLREEIT